MVSLISIAIHPSAKLKWLLILAHSATLFICLLVSMPWILRFICIVLVIIQALNAYWGYEAVSKFTELKLGDDALSVLMDGHWCEVELLRPVVVILPLIILRFSIRSKKVYSLPLLNDSGAREDLRRLRVWLISQNG